MRATSTTKALKAEWTKLRTLPSTWRTAGAATAIAIGMSAAVVDSQVSQWHSLTAQQRQTFDAASASMSGVMVAALLLGALAVRTVTAEYSTGMIRSTRAGSRDGPQAVREVALVRLFEHRAGRLATPSLSRRPASQ